MKVYIVAITDGKYMFPVGSSPRIYKSKTGAQKALDAYKIKNPNRKGVKILCADNWNEEESQ